MKPVMIVGLLALSLFTLAPSAAADSCIGWDSNACTGAWRADDGEQCYGQQNYNNDQCFGLHIPPSGLP